MNRINQLFSDKGEDIMSVYFTAGFPNLDDTLTIAAHLEAAGVDMVEIGIPFSDPVADGPTIQESNAVALQNGMTLSLLFDQLEALRPRVKMPVIMMGYINPIMQYGIAAFCERCQACGIDGLIIPDLPLQEYQMQYRDLFEKAGLKNIFLVSPQTSEQRIKQIDELSDAFIYLVSAAGTTGARERFDSTTEAYLARIKGLKLRNPGLVGFGISNATTYRQACATSQGAIIGSAFIKHLAQYGPGADSVQSFVNQLTTNQPLTA